jgi:hypothetical protein
VGESVARASVVAVSRACEMEFAASPTSDIELRHLELQIIVGCAQSGPSTPGTTLELRT